MLKLYLNRGTYPSKGGMELIRNLTIIGCVINAFSFGVSTNATAQRLPADLAQRYHAIKPTPAELKWQRIPWLTDLAAARQAAQSERRPIFLWVTGDDPLERC